MMDQETIDTIVGLVKEREGIKTAARDSVITAIVRGVVKELEDEKGLALDRNNQYHLMFCVDLAHWRYKNPGGGSGTPRDLQYRLHNLMIHAKAPAEEETS